MLKDKWRKTFKLGKIERVETTYYECDCGFEFRFEDAYDRFTGKLICPYCEDEIEWEKEDYPFGFEPNPYYRDDDEPMSLDAYMRERI